MRLSSSLVIEFQKTHLQIFGESIPADKAEIELLSLAELVRITCPPITEEDENEE